MNDTMAATTDLSSRATAEISGGMRHLLADAFALYLKTKNFHWHMSGSHVRVYHLLVDEQADQIFAMTDAIAERARKIGGRALRSIATSRDTSGCATTTTRSSARMTCCGSRWRTTGS